MRPGKGAGERTGRSRLAVPCVLTPRPPCPASPPPAPSVTEPDYEWLTEQLVAVANATGGRVVSVLEGGYRVQGGVASAFARSVAAHLRALARPSAERYDAPGEKQRLEAFWAQRRARQEAEAARRLEEQNAIHAANLAAAAAQAEAAALGADAEPPLAGAAAAAAAVAAAVPALGDDGQPPAPPAEPEEQPRKRARAPVDYAALEIKLAAEAAAAAAGLGDGGGDGHMTT